jgi:hypothetical protein
VGVKFRRGVMIMNQNKKTYFARTKHMLISAALALFIAGVAISPGLSYAGDRVKPEMVLPKGYPDGFHAWGRIDRIGKERVVIDDELFVLSSGVTYNTPTTLNASKAYFTPGALVGVVTNSKFEVLSLWLLE